LDDYVSEENPVRAIDVFVEALDLGVLGFDGVVPEATGRPGYHPGVLLKIYVYGYINQVASSRRLEREAQRNVEMMWLAERIEHVNRIKGLLFAQGIFDYEPLRKGRRGRLAEGIERVAQLTTTAVKRAPRAWQACGPSRPIASRSLVSTPARRRPSSGSPARAATAFRPRRRSPNSRRV
jgi:hypothetical protein